MPHRPNPPTAIVDPVMMSATASCAVATVLSIPNSFMGGPTGVLVLLTVGQEIIWCFLINSQETSSKEVAIFHGFSRQARSCGAAHRSDEGDAGLVRPGSGRPGGP